MGEESDAQLLGHGRIANSQSKECPALKSRGRGSPVYIATFRLCRDPVSKNQNNNNNNKRNA